MEPIGVVLAGGLGRRIGGSKAVVLLNGKPLIGYPLAAMHEALDEVAVIAKPDTELPQLAGVTVWIEAVEPRHPLAGIVHALALGGGRAVMACPGDLPFVTPELIRRICSHDSAESSVVLAGCGNLLQPLLGCYPAAAIEPLRAALGDATRSAREIVHDLEPTVLEVEDPVELFNVNSPDDLLQAAGMLDARRYPNVKS